MSPDPGLVPLSPEAQAFQQEMLRQVSADLDNIRRIILGILIWGPAATPTSAASPIARTRLLLRDELRSRGHHAVFSEELVDPTSPYGQLAQQLAQVRKSDIVFSLPDSPGSIAEIHDFARLPEASSKIMAFINQQHNNGYSNRTLIELESRATCGIQLYQDESDLPGCVIIPALLFVQRLQEIIYIHGRRLW